MSGTIAVIVPSYNRPRMLAEALASIEGAEQVIVVDDGSDFDAFDVARQFEFPTLSVLYSPPLSPDERMVTARCGQNINNALRKVETDYVGYCCDDDLLAPGWLQAAAKFLDTNPSSHMVRGDWLKFNDDQALSEAEPCVFDFSPALTTGNFVHRTSCATGCGCWWDESTIACHDGAFLGNYLRMHGSTDIAHAGVLAGYRREHPFNMIRWMHPTQNGYRAEAETVLAGRLE